MRNTLYKARSSIILIVVVLFINLFSIGFTSSQISYNDCSIYGNCKPVIKTTSTSSNCSCTGNTCGLTWSQVMNGSLLLNDSEIYTAGNIHAGDIFANSILSMGNTDYWGMSFNLVDLNNPTMNFLVEGGNALTIDKNKNIGINTEAPFEKFHVNGNILSNGTINSTTNLCIQGGVCLDRLSNIGNWTLDKTNYALLSILNNGSYFNSASSDTFIANYSTFLTHITWANAMNGTLFKTSQCY
jgi:hypothetical protein